MARYRTVLIPLVFGLVASVLAQSADFEVTLAGKRVGKATLSHTKTTGGTHSFRTTMVLVVSGQKLDIEQVSSLTASGRPLSSKTTNKTPNATGSVDIVYGLKGVKATVSLNGKAVTTKDLPYPSGKPLSQPSLLWWISSKPKPGTVSTEVELDENTFTFKTTKTTFVGQTTKTVRGKSHKVNEVQTEKGSGWIDNSGIPYRIEQKTPTGLLILERI